MKMSRYCWLFAPSGDYLSIQKQLNRMAENGWELEEPRDGRCYWGKFIPTNRKELRYDVEPAKLFATAAELEETVMLRRADGWEPICTINGMNVYASMPCREPKEKPAEQKSQGWINYGWTLLPLLLAAAVVLLGGLWPEPWYLSNLTAFLHFTRPAVLISAVYLTVWSIFRTISPTEKPTAGWLFALRCILFTLICLWWLLLPISVMTALLPLLYTVGVLLGGLVLFLLIRCPSGIVFGGMLAVSILLCVILPERSYSNLGGMAWREQKTDLITAEQLGLEQEQFISANYTEKGSWLVRQVSYSEKWKEVRVESRISTCRTEALAKQVEADLREKLPSYTVLRKDRQVAAVWTSAGLSPAELEKLLS